MGKIKSEIIDGVIFNNKKAQKSFDDYVSSNDFLQDVISEYSDYILNSINDNICCMLNNEIKNGKVVCEIFYFDFVQDIFESDFWCKCLDIIENKINYHFEDEDIDDDFGDNLSSYMIEKNEKKLIEYCKDIIKIEIK